MSARGSSTRFTGSKTSSNGGNSSSRPSEDCSPDGTSSGLIPNARTLSAVACPTQAILTPENARASRPNSLNFSHTARTALVEVNTTHWNRPSTRPLTARSICAGLRGGSTAMVGTSIGRAPWPTSRSLISPAWSLVRGTSTVQPYRARLSHQFSLARLATVLPMVTTSGPANGPASSLPAGFSSTVLSIRPPSVVSTDRCWQVVPLAVTTAGVLSTRPCSIRVRAASGRCDAVACRISGPGAAASAAQSAVAGTVMGLAMLAGVLACTLTSRRDR